MIVVKIELWSAVTGNVTELGRTYIWNDGTCEDPKRGNYNVSVCKKGKFKPPIIYRNMTRRGRVENYPRASYNIWRLIIRSLKSAFPEEK